jgi:glycosyltransferase involved in cell wall biosynthesis
MVELKITPLVSVIIPNYNGSKYLPEALKSVEQQTYKTVEVHVIDDGSSDASLNVLDDLKKELKLNITVHQHERGINRGVSVSRLVGFEASKGKYIAFLDSDDMFEPNKLSDQVAILENNPEVVLVHTAVTAVFNSKRLATYEQNFNSHPAEPYRYDRLPDYLHRNRICNSSVMVRAASLRQIQFASAQLFQFEDWLCWCLLSKKGKFIFLNQQHTTYRVHENSASSLLSKNKLRELYSLLEFQLTLASRSESAWESVRCLFGALRSLLSLTIIYSSSTADKSKLASHHQNTFLKIVKFIARGVRHKQNLK